jgi:hypothetical protein
MSFGHRSTSQYSFSSTNEKDTFAMHVSLDLLQLVNSHCRNEPFAASTRSRGPETAFTSLIVPSAETTASRSTCPCTPARLARRGYCRPTIRLGTRSDGSAFLSTWQIAVPADKTAQRAAVTRLRVLIPPHGSVDPQTRAIPAPVASALILLRCKASQLQTIGAYEFAEWDRGAVRFQISPVAWET